MACKGILFCLELGLLSLKEKTAIRHRIEAAGGSISATLGSSTHALITSVSEKERGGYKVSSALNLGVPVFTIDDLDHVLANPPSPRKATSALKSTLSARTTSTSSAAPLISWDELPSSVPSDSSPSSASSSDSPYEAYIPAPSSLSALDSSADNWLLGLGDLNLSAPETKPSLFSPSDPFEETSLGYADSDEESELTFGGLFGDIVDKVASRAPRSVSAPTPAVAVVAKPSDRSSSSTTHVVEEDSEVDFMSAFDFDLFGSEYTAPAAARSAPAVHAPAPKMTPKEQLDAKLAMLASKLPASAMSSLRSSLAPKKTLSSSSTAPSAPFSTKLSSTLSPSAAQRERSAKYEAILANRPAPLTIAPISFAPPTFTPLTFELKPTLSTPKTRTPLRSFASTNEKPKIPSPIVFSSLLDDDSSSSSADSPKSSTSLFSAEEEAAKSEGTISEVASEDAGHIDEQQEEHFSEEEYDYEDYDDAWEDDGVEDVSPLTQKATSANIKKIPSGPRVYRDRSTGLAWTKKVEKPQTKLVLDSGDGKAKVMKLDDHGGVALLPSVGDPAAPSASSSSSAAGPRPGIFKPRKIYTGNINPKVSWVDIVLGKASTTKRVPAMDGLKIFVGGFSFDDLRLKGKPAADQLASYKLEYLKKVKAKNEKALKKLKKKAKREALEKATTDEEGRVTVPKAASVKMKDSGLTRMKTDEELVKEIVSWGPKQVAMAIEQRKVMLQSIFKRFGEVTVFNVDEINGFVHVTYKNTASAKAAMRSLADFDTRVAVIRGLRETFTRAAKETFPTPSFYVRWTTCYQRKLNAKKKDTKDAKQTKQDSSVSAKAASAVATAHKVAVPSPSKPLLPEEWALSPVESKLEASFPETH